MGLRRHFRRLREMTGHEGIRDRAGNIWDRLPPVARVIVVAIAIYYTAGLANDLFAVAPEVAAPIAEGTGTVLAAESTAVGTGTVLADTTLATEAGTLASFAPETAATLGEIGAAGQAAATPAAATTATQIAAPTLAGVDTTLTAAETAALAAETAGASSGLTTGQALLAGQALQTVGGALAQPDDPGRPPVTFARPARTGEVTSQGVRIQREQDRVGVLDREARRVPVNVSSLSKRREEDRLLQSIQ